SPRHAPRRHCQAASAGAGTPRPGPRRHRACAAPEPIGGTPMATATVERLVGKAVRRREDPRFLTGRGTFTDDVKLPGTQHAFFVRSPLAHARVVNIDASRALAHSGVRAVFTGKDL